MATPILPDDIDRFAFSLDQAFFEKRGHLAIDGMHSCLIGFSNEAVHYDSIAKNAKQIAIETGKKAMKSLQKRIIYQFGLNITVRFDSRFEVQSLTRAIYDLSILFSSVRDAFFYVESIKQGSITAMIKILTASQKGLEQAKELFDKLQNILESESRRALNAAQTVKVKEEIKLLEQQNQALASAAESSLDSDILKQLHFAKEYLELRMKLAQIENLEASNRKTNAEAAQIETENHKTIMQRFASEVLKQDGAQITINGNRFFATGQRPDPKKKGRKRSHRKKPPTTQKESAS